MLDDVMTAIDAGVYLGKTEKTMRIWFKEGRFPNARKYAGRHMIPHADLDRVREQLEQEQFDQAGEVARNFERWIATLESEIEELKQVIQELRAAQSRQVPEERKQQHVTSMPVTGRRRNDIPEVTLPSDAVYMSELLKAHEMNRNRGRAKILANLCSKDFLSLDGENAR